MATFIAVAEAGSFTAAADRLDVAKSVVSRRVAALEARLGVRFEVVRESSWDAVLEQTRARNIDLLAAAVKTPQRSEYLDFTEPHIKLPGVIIADTSQSTTLTMADLAGRQVAVVSGRH